MAGVRLQERNRADMLESMLVLIIMSLLNINLGPFDTFLLAQDIMGNAQEEKSSDTMSIEIADYSIDYITIERPHVILLYLTPEPVSLDIRPMSKRNTNLYLLDDDYFHPYSDLESSWYRWLYGD